jgi:putative spermidine/putrescine transport system permease protein
MPDSWALLALPGLVFLLVFFGYPLLELVLVSLREPGPENYLVFGDSPVYARVLVTTFRTAALVTVICLVLGYPYAYMMHRSGRRAAAVLAALVLLPFWSSLLVRTYAWVVLLQDSGVINGLLTSLGLIGRPLPLIRNSFGVTVGMSQILLPFMVLPLWAAMRRIDWDLTRAAAGLGAGPFTAFRRVFLPLSLPGVYAGSLLVFVLALGFYITPAVLGSPRDALLSELVVNQVTRQLQFGVGSALGVVLLLCTLVVLAVGSRFARVGAAVGHEDP